MFQTLPWICCFLFVVFFVFSLRFLQNQKIIRENQTYQRKPKKTTKTHQEKPKTTKFVNVSDPPLDMGLLLLFFLVFPKVFTKPNNHSRKSNIQKKTNENQQNIRKNQQNKVCKCFRPTLGYVFLFLFFLVFPKVFTKPNNHSRKPKIQKTTKEHQHNIRKNLKNKVCKWFRPTLGYGFGVFCFLVFPKVFTKPKKPSRKQHIQKKTQQIFGKPKKETYPRVGLNHLQTLLFWLFLMFLWFSLVFFCIFGFLE